MALAVSSNFLMCVGRDGVGNAIGFEAAYPLVSMAPISAFSPGFRPSAPPLALGSAPDQPDAIVALGEDATNIYLFERALGTYVVNTSSLAKVLCLARNDGWGGL